VSNPRYVPADAAMVKPSNGAVAVVNGALNGLGSAIAGGAAPGSSVTVRPAIKPAAL
jgi:hypothetical protein